MNKHGWPAGPGAALLSLEEYELLPEEDGYTQELAEGRLVREPRPGARHGVVVGDLFRTLDSFVRDRDLGRVVIETGFLLAEDPPTVRGPDVAFIAAEHLPVGPVPEGFWRLAPDLAVEVVSPSDSAAEVQEKVLQYLDAGTRTVWVVQPRTRTVEVWRPGADMRVIREEETLEGGDVLPGLRLEVRSLFDF
jgi:Uma2 family endonuclease